MKATILILMTGSGLLCAQAPQGQQGPPPKPPVMKVLDADGDGKLSPSEIENASEVLSELDSDGNGRLSKEETRPPRPEGEDGERRRPRGGRGGEGERPEPPIMTALDQNGDGTISKREMKRASKSLLEMDEDESGSIESEEMEPEKRPEGGPEGGRGQGGGGPEGGPRPPRPPRRR